TTIITGITLPSSIAITPSGAFAYVTGSGGVAVIDTATNTVTATVPAGSSVVGVAITPNGAFAYVTRPQNSEIIVISTATNTVVQHILLGFPPNGIAITPNGAFAYFSSSEGGVGVINTATNTFVTVLFAGSETQGVAIDPSGTFAYVAIQGNNTVRKIKTTTNTVVATIAVGSRPQFIAFPVPTQGPANKDQCKDGGWATFTNPTFSNQGQCIKFVNHMDEHEH